MGLPPTQGNLETRQVIKYYFHYITFHFITFFNFIYLFSGVTAVSRFFIHKPTFSKSFGFMVPSKEMSTLNYVHKQGRRKWKIFFKFNVRYDNR